MAPFTAGVSPLKRAWAQYAPYALGAEQDDAESLPDTFAEFLSGCVSIADRGGVRFKPWPWQDELARALPRIRRLIVLKARQLGLSWLFGSYAADTALRRRGATVLLFSQTENDAKKLKGKAQFVYDHLPAGLRQGETRQNMQTLAFPGIGSTIEAFPSTEKAGRGVSAAALAIMDEFAYHQWADLTMTAVAPAVEADGQLFVLSTANGIGNAFHAQWAAAAGSMPPVIPQRRPDGLYSFGDALERAIETLPAGAWLPIYLPYYVRPGRDEEWRENERKVYQHQPWRFAQEYPGESWEEAFIQTGRPVFGKQYLDIQKALCREPLPQDQWPAPFRETLTWDGGSIRFAPDELRVFDLPVEGHRYVAGGDVAEGLEHGDYSDLSVWDLGAQGEEWRPREVLTLHGHWAPDVFARLIHAVSLVYPGRYGIERNNHGLTVLTVLQQLGTKGLFRERDVFDPTTKQVLRVGKLGWTTDRSSKPIAIDDLEEAVRATRLQLSDALAIPEFTFYRTNDDGSTSAPSGNHDDRVMSRSIAWQMRKHLPRKLDMH